MNCHVLRFCNSFGLYCVFPVPFDRVDMSSHNPNLDQPLEPTDSAEARMRLALGLGTRPAHSGQPATASSPVPATHDSGRQRRRFAQDGDVPVVILHRGRDAEAGGENKLAALTADLREERAARQKSERALDEANVLISSLKTKLKHAEMALEEKTLAESEARAQWDAVLVAEREARQQAETKAAESALALSLLERKMESAGKQNTASVEAAKPLPAPDLFGEPDAAPAPPPGPKRQMSKKTVGRAARSAVAAPPQPEQSAEPAGEDEDKPIEWWLPSFRATRKVPVRRKRVTS
jgi:hypothetical protein